MKNRNYSNFTVVLGLILLAAGTAAAQAGGGADAFRQAWVSKTGDWNKAVAVAPWGDVVSSSYGTLRVHGRDSGRVLDTVTTCSAIDQGLGFKNDQTAILVCSREIVEISLPGGADHQAVELADTAVAAAFGGGLVAVALENETIQVYRAEKWKKVDTLKVEKPVEGLALSADGKKLAVGFDGACPLVKDVGSKKSATLSSCGDVRTQALSFSPDGGSLFAASGSFKASVWDLKQGSVSAEFSTGSWLSAARFVTADLIAATGSEGFVLYQTGSKDPARTLSYSAATFAPSAEGLAVSDDGGLLCAGDRDGDVACFSVVELKPTGYVRSAAGAGPAIATVAPMEFFGKISKRKGKALTIAFDEPGEPAGGTLGTLYKFFDKKLGTFSMSGWLEIASVQVQKNGKGGVQLKIIEEKSAMKINKKKVNHFITGTRVKLVTGK